MWADKQGATVDLASQSAREGGRGGEGCVAFKLEGVQAGPQHHPSCGLGRCQCLLAMEKKWIRYVAVEGSMMERKKKSPRARRIECGRPARAGSKCDSRLSAESLRDDGSWLAGDGKTIDEVVVQDPGESFQSNGNGQTRKPVQCSTK